MAKDNGSPTGFATGIFDDIPRPERKRGNRKARWLGVGVILAAMGGLIVWASLAPLSSAVVSQGQIVVSSKHKLVQHRDGGIIQRINVRDGAIVKAGDVLIVLNGAEAYLRHVLMRAAYYSARATKHRLLAEKQESAKLHFPTQLLEEARKDQSIASILETERELFLSRRMAHAGQVSVLRQRIAQIEEEIKGYEAEAVANREQSRIARTELKIVKVLFDRGYTTRVRVAALERERAGLLGSAGKLEAALARAKANIGETELKILQLTKEFNTNVFKDLKEVEDRIFDIREKLESAAVKVEQLRIRAPTGGEVVNMQVSTVGGVIQPGDTVLEIVPADDRLIIEARVRPVDVDHIAVGLDTQVRITAFKQRTTPLLDGKVILVSGDALLDARSGEHYFLVQIEVIQSERTRAAVERLQPGMPAEALIITGQRTAFAYLLQPIMDSVNRAMREQ